MLDAVKVFNKEKSMLDLINKISYQKQLDLFKTFLRDIEAKESALIKWEFVDWALKTGAWEIKGIGYIRTLLDGDENLTFFVNSDNCKLCSLYWENTEGNSNCTNCPLKPFSGVTCERVWEAWREDRKPMLEAIVGMLLSYGLDPEEVLQRNLNLLEWIL